MALQIRLIAPDSLMLALLSAEKKNAFRTFDSIITDITRTQSQVYPSIHHNHHQHHHHHRRQVDVARVCGNFDENSKHHPSRSLECTGEAQEGDGGAGLSLHVGIVGV